MLPNSEHSHLLQLTVLGLVLKPTIWKSDFLHGKVQLAEDNYLWHEPEEANIIDKVQTTNLIMVFSIELSFKLIISWIWGMMSWCLIIYIFYIYKLKAVSTEFSHVKFWMDNLDGFCIQIIHNSIGEKGPMGYWNWTIAQDYLNSSFN